MGSHLRERNSLERFAPAAEALYFYYSLVFFSISLSLTPTSHVYNGDSGTIFDWIKPNYACEHGDSTRRLCVCVCVCVKKPKSEKREKYC